MRVGFHPINFSSSVRLQSCCATSLCIDGDEDPSVRFEQEEVSTGTESKSHVRRKKAIARRRLTHHCKGRDCQDSRCSSADRGCTLPEQAFGEGNAFAFRGNFQNGTWFDPQWTLFCVINKSTAAPASTNIIAIGKQLVSLCGLVSLWGGEVTVIGSFHEQ